MSLTSAGGWSRRRCPKGDPSRAGGAIPARRLPSVPSASVRASMCPWAQNSTKALTLPRKKHKFGYATPGYPIYANSIPTRLYLFAAKSGSGAEGNLASFDVGTTMLAASCCTSTSMIRSCSVRKISVFDSSCTNTIGRRQRCARVTTWAAVPRLQSQRAQCVAEPRHKLLATACRLPLSLFAWNLRASPNSWSIRRHLRPFRSVTEETG